MPCPVSAGGTRDCRVFAKPREDGNVVISGSFQLHGRFTARPGRYKLKLDDNQCAPVPIEVAAGDDLTYAYITYTEAKRGGCRSFELTARKTIKL